MLGFATKRLGFRGAMLRIMALRTIRGRVWIVLLVFLTSVAALRLLACNHAGNVKMYTICMTSIFIYAMYINTGCARLVVMRIGLE